MYFAIIGDTSQCPYNSDRIGLKVDEVCDFDETNCYYGPWDDGTYWVSVDEEEFLSFYYHNGNPPVEEVVEEVVVEEEEEETI